MARSWRLARLSGALPCYVESVGHVVPAVGPGREDTVASARRADVVTEVRTDVAHGGTPVGGRRAELDRRLERQPAVDRARPEGIHERVRGAATPQVRVPAETHVAEGS